MVQQSVTNSYSIRNSSHLATVPSLAANQAPDPSTQPRTLTEVVKAVRGLGLNPEICGSWVWIFGTDGSHETPMRDLGLHWSSRKGGWYWRPKTLASNFNPKRDSWSMEAIRKKYGSRRVTA